MLRIGSGWALGVIGLVVGDALLFQAFVWVGPRLGMLMMSLAPIIAALVARFFLGESLLPLQWLANPGRLSSGWPWSFWIAGGLAFPRAKSRTT